MLEGSKILFETIFNNQLKLLALLDSFLGTLLNFKFRLEDILELRLIYNSLSRGVDLSRLVDKVLVLFGFVFFLEGELLDVVRKLLVELIEL